MGRGSLPDFRDGYDTKAFGRKTYASRPLGEVHGPFRAKGDAIVLEISSFGQGRRSACYREKEEF